MSALVIGLLLALAALAYVLHPLFAELPDQEPAPDARITGDANRAAADGDEAIAALREIEFDRETGKLSERDYEILRSSYSAAAIREMRVSDSRHAARTQVESHAKLADGRFAARSPEASHATRSLRACERCGPRAEPDALYCSSCGHFLAETCPTCGAPAGEQGAVYCSACGRSLAA